MHLLAGCPMNASACRQLARFAPSPEVCVEPIVAACPTQKLYCCPTGIADENTRFIKQSACTGVQDCNRLLPRGCAIPYITADILAACCRTVVLLMHGRHILSHALNPTHDCNTCCATRNILPECSRTALLSQKKLFPLTCGRASSCTSLTSSTSPATRSNCNTLCK
jgi:hypothetical protein